MIYHVPNTPYYKATDFQKWQCGYAKDDKPYPYCLQNGREK